MSLLLPPKVQAEIQKVRWKEQRAERRAVLFGMLDFDDPVCKEWRPLLRQLDPFLMLGRALPMAYEPGFHVRPGYYHWVRDNPTADLTVEAITGPDGEWTEPDSGLLERLKRNDLQDPRVWAAVIAQQAQQEVEREKALDLERERLNQEVIERYAAGNRAFVSMDRENAWTQSARGRRGAKR